jgi:hypothetical protein
MSDDYPEIQLEVELDLPLDPEDIARYHSYVSAGASEYEAATRVAQDILGGDGAIVQGATAVPA